VKIIINKIDKKSQKAYPMLLVKIVEFGIKMNIKKNQMNRGTIPGGFITRVPPERNNKNIRENNSIM